MDYIKAVTKTIREKERCKKERDNADKLKCSLWGIPNWKNMKEYPENWKRISAEQQRWEFLRRNEQYRTDLENLCKNPLVIPSRYKGWERVKHTKGVSPRAIASKYGISKPINPATLWKDRPDGFYFKIPATAGGKIVFPQEACPFSKDQAASDMPCTIDRRKELSQETVEARNLGWYDLIVHVEFDLEYALKPQLTEAEKTLMKARRDAVAFMNELAKGGDDGNYPARKVGSRTQKPKRRNILRCSTFADM